MSLNLSPKQSRGAVPQNKDSVFSATSNGHFVCFVDPLYIT